MKDEATGPFLYSLRVPRMTVFSKDTVNPSTGLVGYSGINNYYP